MRAGKSPLSRPAEQGESSRKRRRKIWSCLECRRRKLQCDRAYPACSRCVKAGTEAQCSYIDDLGLPQPEQPAFHDRFRPSEKAQASALNHDSAGSNQTVRLKKKDSTNFIIERDSLLGANKLSPAQCRDLIQLPDCYSRIKYKGSTHIRSLVYIVPGLSGFSKEAREKHSSVDQIRTELHRLQITMLKRLSKQPRPESEEDLRKLLPPRLETNRLVDLYLNSYDHVYNILDHSAFLKEYNELWITPEGTNVNFILVVILIVAIARSLSALSAEGNSRIQEQTASLIEACEAFLAVNLRKQTSIIDYQVGFLTLLARQICGNRFKRTWSNAGWTLRGFMCRHSVSAGLHRGLEADETPLPLSEDVGRRIWLSLAEFELQAAFEQGMPAIPWPQSSDLLPPKTSIEDEDQEFGRSSYLSLARHSLLLRHSLNSVLNNIHEPVTYAETKTWTEKLQAYLYALPSWSNSEALVPQALLRLNLLQYILALHERQIREAKTAFEQNASRTILLETALDMIDIHQSVVDSGNYAVELLFEDHIRAALTICYVYASMDGVTDSFLTRVASPHALRGIERAVTLLSLKARRYGFDHQQMWTTIAAAAFMQATDRSDEKDAYMQQAAKRFADLFEEKVSQEKPIDNGLADETGLTNGINNAQQPTFDGPDIWGIEDWMLDEWPFENGALDGLAVL